MEPFRGAILLHSQKDMNYHEELQDEVKELRREVYSARRAEIRASLEMLQGRLKEAMLQNNDPEFDDFERLSILDFVIDEKVIRNYLDFI